MRKKKVWFSHSRVNCIVCNTKEFRFGMRFVPCPLADLSSSHFYFYFYFYFYDRPLQSHPFVLNDASLEKGQIKKFLLRTNQIYFCPKRQKKTAGKKSFSVGSLRMKAKNNQMP